MLTPLIFRIFQAYADMEPSVQTTIQELITPLIKSLGSNNAKLLTLMKTFPDGSESLALRVLKIFTEHGRPSGALVSLVKGLITERNLDARFLIPIIAEMDKVWIIHVQIMPPFLTTGTTGGHYASSTSHCRSPLK